MKALSCFVAVLAGLLTGCTAQDDAPSTDEGEVRIDTTGDTERAQYDAAVDFVTNYQPRCTKPRADGVKRVLISGYGRFMSNRNNATGRIVSALAGLAYPETNPPAAGAVDPLAPQLAVRTQTVRWPESGAVEICALILPVVWDVAPIVLLRELAAFKPDLVLMNGIADVHQDLWIELGGVNEAAPYQDGTNLLVPYTRDGESIPLLDGAPATHPNSMSWDIVSRAANAAIERATADHPELADILYGAVLAGFPRSGNTYLCNNITFTTSYLMDSPGTRARLLEASTPIEGRTNFVDVRLPGDFRAIPRTFLHWPSALEDGDGPAIGARIVAALADAQLSAIEPPSPGNNDLADPSLRGGSTF